MSGHKKNWFQRIFGTPSDSRSADPVRNSSPSSPDTTSEDPRMSDNATPSSASQGRGRQGHAAQSVNSAREHPSTHPEPEDPARPHSSDSLSNASASSAAHPSSSGDSSQDAASSSRTSAHRHPASSRTSVTAGTSLPYKPLFDPSRLDDVTFYRTMRVILQPIEEAKSSLGSVTSAQNCPLREFSEDTAVRLALDTTELFEQSPGNPYKKPAAATARRSRGSRGMGWGVSSREPYPLGVEDLADRGRVEDLFRMGYRNLWQDLIDSDLHVKELSPSEGEMVWAFQGSSPYVGSAPIFLEELVQRFLPEVDISVGLLFTMPSNSQMLVRDVTSGKELFQTIGLLATASADEFFKTRSKLSPRLHLWHEGQIETISDIKLPPPGETQTEIQIKPTAYLMSQMNEDPEPPEDWLPGFED